MELFTECAGKIPNPKEDSILSIFVTIQRRDDDDDFVTSIFAVDDDKWMRCGFFSADNIIVCRFV